MRSVIGAFALALITPSKIASHTFTPSIRRYCMRVSQVDHLFYVFRFLVHQFVQSQQILEIAETLVDLHPLKVNLQIDLGLQTSHPPQRFTQAGFPYPDDVKGHTRLVAQTAINLGFTRRDRQGDGLVALVNSGGWLPKLSRITKCTRSATSFSSSSK